MPKPTSYPTRMVSNMGKSERLAACNGLLSVIADCGRRFFRHEDAVAQLELDRRGRVFFHDAYTRKRIYTHYRGRWRGFSNGGTLKNLVEAMRDYIVKGRPIPACVFGPWPYHVCGGDLWGYGDDMDHVRHAAMLLGVINTKEICICAAVERIVGDLAEVSLADRAPTLLLGRHILEPHGCFRGGAWFEILTGNGSDDLEIRARPDLENNEYRRRAMEVDLSFLDELIGEIDNDC